MRLLSTLVLGALILAAGCDKAETATSPAPAATAAAADKPKGPTAECIICVGHEIEVTPETARTEHDGKTYYFCSDYCKKEFVADPAKALATYNAKKAAAAATTKPSGH